MIKKITSMITLFSFVFMLSCGGGSYVKQMQESEKLFYSGKYKAAARKLLPVVNKSGKDQLLFQMECGTMLHAAGDFKNSNDLFLTASKTADKITTSISHQAASLFVNDRVTNYKGEDFERVLVHMYAGINYLMLNDPENARVEFKQVNNQLQAINSTGGMSYKQNIMAKYLTAIAFEVSAEVNKDDNDLNFAYVEYKQIHQLAPQLVMVKYDLMRIAKKLNDMEDYRMWQQKFNIRDQVKPDMGELVVIYQAGRGAVKRSRGSLLKDKNMHANIRIAFNSQASVKAGVTLAAIYATLKTAENPIPRFIKRANRVKALVIEADGKYLARTNLLEDIEYTAVKNMEEQYGRMYAKVAASIVVKAIAAVAAGAAAKKVAKHSRKTKGVAGLLGLVVGAAVGAGLMSQIKPDLRCWHTLPANLQLNRIFLTPGVYEFTIKLVDRANRILAKRKHKINIQKGKKSILNYRTLF